MLQVDSVLQKRKNVLVMYEKDTNTASKCLFLFSVRWKPSADSPEDVPLLDLQRLWCVGYWMSTFIHITHCMDCKMHLHCWMGSMPFFCTKKIPTASFQFPSAASVCGALFLVAKIKRYWSVRKVDANSSCVSISQRCHPQRFSGQRFLRRDDMQGEGGVRVAGKGGIRKFLVWRPWHIVTKQLFRLD